METLKIIQKRTSSFGNIKSNETRKKKHAIA